jgi:hypothetical protein
VSRSEDLRGPLDAVEWPTKLAARVVAPGPRPMLHGYDVEDDLARHYSFAETVLLALTGEPPSPERGRAFEVALVFASPITVGEAPANAAVVARACMASVSQTLGVAAVGLSEQTRALVQEHAAWIEALSEASLAELPAHLRAATDEERASVERLRRALGGTIDVPALALDPSRRAALLAVLHACGVDTPARIECALVWARLPVAMAEALAATWGPAGAMQYPVPLPLTVYDEELP